MSTMLEGAPARKESGQLRGPPVKVPQVRGENCSAIAKLLCETNVVPAVFHEEKQRIDLLRSFAKQYLGWYRWGKFRHNQLTLMARDTQSNIVDAASLVTEKGDVVEYLDLLDGNGGRTGIRRSFRKSVRETDRNLRRYQREIRQGVRSNDSRPQTLGQDHRLRTLVESQLYGPSGIRPVYNELEHLGVPTMCTEVTRLVRDALQDHYWSQQKPENRVLLGNKETNANARNNSLSFDGSALWQKILSRLDPYLTPDEVEQSVSVDGFDLTARAMHCHKTLLGVQVPADEPFGWASIHAITMVVLEEIVKHRTVFSNGQTAAARILKARRESGTRGTHCS